MTVTNFIMKAFINGRMVFGTPLTTFPPEYPTRMVSDHKVSWAFGRGIGICYQFDLSLSIAGVFL